MTLDDINRIGKCMDDHGATCFVAGGNELHKVFRLARLALEAREVVEPIAKAVALADSVDEPGVTGVTLHLYARVAVEGEQFDAANFPLDTTCSEDQLRAAAAWLAKMEGSDD